MVSSSEKTTCSDLCLLGCKLSTILQHVWIPHPCFRAFWRLLKPLLSSSTVFSLRMRLRMLQLASWWRRCRSRPARRGRVGRRGHAHAGVGRARVYQLLDTAVLEAVDTQPLEITLGSVQRRLQGVPPVGAQRITRPLSRHPRAAGVTTRDDEFVPIEEGQLTGSYDLLEDLLT